MMKMLTDLTFGVLPVIGGLSGNVSDRRDETRGRRGRRGRVHPRLGVVMVRVQTARVRHEAIVLVLLLFLLVVVL